MRIFRYRLITREHSTPMFALLSKCSKIQFSNMWSNVSATQHTTQNNNVFTSYYRPAVPLYVPREAKAYFACAESTLKLSNSAYALFPSKSATSTRSRWRLSDVSKWRLSLPAHISNTLCVVTCIKVNNEAWMFDNDNNSFVFTLLCCVALLC